MFAALHSDINSIKSVLLHLTSQLKSRGAEGKDGIRYQSLSNYLIDRYTLQIVCTYHEIPNKTAQLRVESSGQTTFSGSLDIFCAPLINIPMRL
jgi:hypothetical protein